MRQHDSDGGLLDELKKLRLPPAPPGDAMWSVIAPAVPKPSPVPVRAHVWTAALAIAASLLIWVSAAYTPVAEPTMSTAAADLERTVTARLAVLPDRTSASIRLSLDAMSLAIDDLRALAAARPGDAELAASLERLERQRLEALAHALEDIAIAQTLGDGRRKLS